uniref:Uncharacterized protein LOC111113910 n=1 Tax=Crassostrea virginica TaxID=6565 RepID=A0A8B8BYI5_CRAVI|nr:uncharacterized protein LOC111113910 [Crassostrea virginica]
MPSRYHKASEIYQNKQEVIRNDLEELKKLIYPKYQEAATNIPVKRGDGSQHWQKLRSALHKQGEVLHQAVDDIIQTRQEEIDDQAPRYTTAIDKHEGVINAAIKEIKQTIQNLKNLLDTSDFCLVSGYKSSNEKLRRLPPKLKASLSDLQPVKINTEQFLKEFVSLSPLSVETEEQGFTVPSPGTESSPAARPLLDVPHLITDIPTGNRDLSSVSCLSDEEIWTIGECTCKNTILKLYNMKGKIQTLIRLRGWEPLGLCTTSSGNLMVIMFRYYRQNSQTRVVRSSDSKEKQWIQWDDNVQWWWSARPANSGFPSASRKFFHPHGITTDSQANILTADFNNARIHIIDQDGHFLRYIDNCGLKEPCSLCVDARDNLFVAEYNTGKVKKLQYYK